MVKREFDIPQIEQAEQIEAAHRIHPGDPLPDPDDLDPKTANVLYYDWKAQQLDDGSSFVIDDRAVADARRLFASVAPDKKYAKALEIGAGTGLFGIALARAGLVHEPYASDISPGMVALCLRAAQANNVVNMKARTADAEALPFDTDFFDLVVGRSIFHHLPDPDAGIREAFRVLRPGGVLVIAGEPTRVGSEIQHIAERVTETVSRTIGSRFNLVRDEEPEASEAALSQHVSLGRFDPGTLKRTLTDAGFANATIATAGLLGGLFDASVRTIESVTRPGLIGPHLTTVAGAASKVLGRIDDLLLRRIAPKTLFGTLILSAEKPKD